MKKWMAVVMVISFMLCSSGVAVGSDANPRGLIGPAPNSGDGIPDGSGFDQPNRINEKGFGPAPNSGDGIPDGSGFTPPNGPYGSQTPETRFPLKSR